MIATKATTPKSSFSLLRGKERGAKRAGFKLQVSYFLVKKEMSSRTM